MDGEGSYLRQGTIFITCQDRDRLKNLILKIFNERSRDMAHLSDLGEELERGEIVESRVMPPNVITMNSRFRLKDVENGEIHTFTLVYPEEANVDEGKISVLAPVGTAMLGYRVGDTVEWQTPGGLRKLRIEELLYQPEAAGDFHR